MQPPFPSATPTWHNDTYSSISPSRPELSVAGKTVVITGAGSGIGRAAAVAFKSAGAASLVLLGRNESTLKETQSAVQQQPQASTSTDGSGSGAGDGAENCPIHAVSVTDSEALRSVAASVGRWDVLVLNAGFVSTPAAIADANEAEWWQSFETNTKSIITTAQAFLPTANPAHAAILNVTTGTASVPASHTPGLSAYVASKLAAAKALEFLAAEQPQMFVASVHPGMVDTKIFRKAAGEDAASKWPMDTVELPAHFMVWLASPEAAFLKGRLVWANWDVDELKGLESKVTAGLDMTTGVLGWPYPHVG